MYYVTDEGGLPKSVKGGELPLARYLRTFLFPDETKDTNDKTLSLAFVVFGQFLNNDVVFIDSTGNCKFPHILFLLAVR